jgi:predicted phage gp36 major capsid-like protein
MLSRNNSVRELGVFAETANAVNRLIQRHLSMNEVCAVTPTAAGTTTLDRGALVEGVEEQQPGDEEESSDDVSTPCQDNVRLTSPRELGIFHLGFDDDDDVGIGRLSEEEEDDVMSAVQGLSLTTPDGSHLARRRLFQQQHACESSVDSGNVSVGGSPPDSRQQTFDTSESC